MWMVEDALQGRISAGRGRNGGPEGAVTLRLEARRLYQLQKYLEERIAKGGDYFEIRMLVLLSEELRQGVIEGSAAGAPLFAAADDRGRL